MVLGALFALYFPFSKITICIKPKVFHSHDSALHTHIPFILHLSCSYRLHVTHSSLPNPAGFLWRAGRHGR
jgi:hypothetical protein